MGTRSKIALQLAAVLEKWTVRPDA